MKLRTYLVGKLDLELGGGLYEVVYLLSWEVRLGTRRGLYEVVYLLSWEVRGTTGQGPV